jgi:hypothetical protein
MNIFKLGMNKIVLGATAAFSIAMVAAPSMALAQDEAPRDVFGIGGIEGDDGEGIVLGKASLQQTVAKLINVALSMLGMIAVVIVLIGGFKWMTAGGNEEKVGEARKLIFAGIVGMAIILSAWAIARFVLVQLSTATEVQGIATDRLNNAPAE